MANAFADLMSMYQTVADRERRIIFSLIKLLESALDEGRDIPPADLLAVLQRDWAIDEPKETLQ